MQIKGDQDGGGGGIIGLTTEIALLLTFALGAASVSGGDGAGSRQALSSRPFFLTIKARLHRFVARIDRLELDAVIKARADLRRCPAAAARTRDMDPAEPSIPTSCGGRVVVVAGLSFLGYLGMRLAGAGLGILMTGIFRRSRVINLDVAGAGAVGTGAPGARPGVAAGIVVAGAITFLGILVLVGVFQPALLAPLALPMAAMAATGLIGAALNLLFKRRQACGRRRGQRHLQPCRDEDGAAVRRSFVGGSAGGSIICAPGRDRWVYAAAAAFGPHRCRCADNIDGARGLRGSWRSKPACSPFSSPFRSTP